MKAYHVRLLPMPQLRREVLRQVLRLIQLRLCRTLLALLLPRRMRIALPEPREDSLLVVEERLLCDGDCIAPGQLPP